MTEARQERAVLLVLIPFVVAAGSPRWFAPLVVAAWRAARPGAVLVGLGHAAGAAVLALLRTGALVVMTVVRLAVATGIVGLVAVALVGVALVAVALVGVALTVVVLSVVAGGPNSWPP